MRTIPVSAENTYQIEVDVDWRTSLVDWTEGRSNVLIICSENFPVDTEFPTIQIPDGESGKTVSTLQNLWQKFAEHQIGRDDLIVAIGGGDHRCYRFCRSYLASRNRLDRNPYKSCGNG